MRQTDAARAHRAWLWILAPLTVGLLYAGLHPLFAPAPSLADVVPEEAVLTHRFANLAALNEGWFRPKSDTTPAGEREAAQRNLAGLPGVDPERPFHLVFLRRKQRPDPTMMIYPVADPDRLRQRFDDPTFFLEKGYVRHAQHLEIRGAFAAVSGDREAVRRIGGGGLTATRLGEDHVVAASIPDLVEFALAAPSERPWQPILRALGFDPSTRPADEEVPGGALFIAPRLLRVAETWDEARLWSWIGERRIRLDLLPNRETEISGLLAQVVKQQVGSGDRIPTAPLRAQAWLRIPGALERAVMVWALLGAGVPLPDPPGAWGETGGDGVLLWASPSTGIGYAWTLGVAAPAGSLPALTPFCEAIPDAPGDAEAAEGVLALTLAHLQLDRVAPAGKILRRERDGLTLVTLGASAEEVWRRFEGWIAAALQRPDVDIPVAEGWRVVASFGLSEARARTILGDQLERGGVLRPLQGGDIEGALLTNGRILRLEAHVTRRP